MPKDGFEQVEETVKAVSAKMAEMIENNKKINEDLRLAATENGTVAKDALKRAEEVAAQQTAFAEAIKDMEQQLAARVTEGKAPVQTLGRMMIESDQFKAFAKGETKKIRIEANTITGQEGSPPENSAVLVQADRQPGIVPGAFRRLRMAEILNVSPTVSNAVEYTKETAFTNAAAETAEAAGKPESDVTFELVTANIRTIAHYLRLSKQVLEDAPMLQSYIDTRLRYGVDVRYDLQILKGDGTGQNLSGMTASGNMTAFTPTTGENQLDSINRAIEAVETADYFANAIVLHPQDWYAIDRLKVGSSDDRYIVGDPSRMGIPVLWGKPVIVTAQQTAGKQLVADFAVAYHLFNRSETAVEMFEQDSDNVTENLVTVRAERRGALASLVPAAARYGDLTL